MRGKQPQKNRPAATVQISAADFAALRDFLRGYLHEDVVGEYGSPEGAVQQFCHDAGASQVEAVASQWRELLHQTQGQPIAEINLLLNRKLGCAWSFTNPHELKKVADAFVRCARR